MDDINTDVGIYEAKNHLTAALIAHGSQISSATRAALVSALSEVSPVNCLVQTVEALYAGIKTAGGSIDDSLRYALGEAAFLVTNNAWHGQADRASSILDATRRGLGFTVDGADPDPIEF